MQIFLFAPTILVFSDLQFSLEFLRKHHKKDRERESFREYKIIGILTIRFKDKDVETKLNTSKFSFKKKNI